MRFEIHHFHHCPDEPGTAAILQALAELKHGQAVILAALLKSELKRADVGYAELAKRLSDMGLAETEGSITVKINRGGFPAWFMLAAMRAIGAHTLRLE